MQIQTVKFNSKEVEEIYQKLIELFDTETAEYKFHTVNFELEFDGIICSFEALLNLYCNYWVEGDNIRDKKSVSTVDRNVIDFTIYCWVNGDDEVKSNLDLTEKINQYYKI